MRGVAFFACLLLAGLSLADAATPVKRLHESFLGAPHAAATCSVNGFPGTCKSISSCIAEAEYTAVPGHCSGPADEQCCIQQTEAKAGCGTSAVKRAMTWVNADVQYCQAAQGEHDYDNACASICVRAHNRAWDPYRSDCSGFVSYAYGLPAPGRITGQFAPYATDVSFKLSSPRDLTEGDAINSTPAEHIMLFHSWLNAAKTRARFIEEPGCSAAVPHAKVTDTDVTINDNGTIHLACNGMTFFPIRFFSNSKVC